jgi:hypothetical protein
MAADRDRTVEWLNQDDLSAQWRWYSTRSSDGEHDGRWGDHIDEMKRVVGEHASGELKFGRPPRNLVQVLAKVGISGFGCCSLRSLCPIGYESVDIFCKDYTDTWVFNIAAFVEYLWGLDNNGSKLLQIRFYPVK